jgi:hypothetical protein
LAKKGILQSGGRYAAETEIRIRKLATSVVERAIAKRKELGRRVPELLTTEPLNRLKDKLNTFIDGLAKGHQARIEDDSRQAGFAPATSQAFSRLAEQAAQSINASANQTIEALRLEAKLGMHEEERQVTLNISHSTIASLNLGTVMGDLSASVKNLGDQGQRTLAAAIRALAEGVAASTDVNDATRKELLEHLTLISTETARPAEHRKLGPIRMSVNFLREGISQIAALVSTWQAAEHILRGMGVIP